MEDNNMKKYIKPTTETIIINASSVICMSIPFGEECNNPTGETKDVPTMEDLTDIFGSGEDVW